jgi:hypothetical protein
MASINFPSSPSLNDRYLQNGVTFIWNGFAWNPDAEALLAVSEMPPDYPSSGDLWWNSQDANLYVYYDDGTSAQWVTAARGVKGDKGTNIASEINYDNSVSGLTATNINAAIDEVVSDLNTAVSDIGTDISDAVSALEDSKVSKTSDTGSAAVPSGTEAQRDVTPSAGYFRFNIDLGKFEGYNGTSWGSVGGGATGGSSDEVFVQNDQVVTANYTIPVGKNAMSTGPITVDTGVAVTVSSGSRWVVL